MILFFSRILTNILDEGSKYLVYNIAKSISLKLSLFTEKNFRLELNDNKTPIRIDIQSSFFIEDSVSLKSKIQILIKFFFNLLNHKYIHFFFTLTKANALLLIMSNCFRKKVLVTIPAINKKELKSCVVKHSLKMASSVIVFSKYSKNILNDYTNNISIVPPLVDHNRFNPEIRQNSYSIKQKLKIDHDFVVLFPGEYSRLDSNDNIVEIIKRTNKIDKNILFILSCRLKWEKDKIVEDKMKKKLLNCNALFINTVDNYDEYLAISDLSIFPVKTMSGKFDLPLSLIESVVMGVPVLFSDISPLNELYCKKDYIIIDKNDCDKFVQEILKLKNDKMYYKDNLDKTHAAANFYNPEFIIKEYEKLYRE